MLLSVAVGYQLSAKLLTRFNRRQIKKILFSTTLAVDSAATLDSFKPKNDDFSDNLKTFRYKDLEITTIDEKQRKIIPVTDNIRFGSQFSDHMLEIEWTMANGWCRPKIVPLHNLSLHPAAKVLHYATELFEGMKAYRGIDNVIRMFRPELNMERMVTSANRACLPEFEPDELLECICELVRLDRDWVPYSPTSSLYIRPTMIGTDPTLGVAQSNRAMCYVIVGPVSAFFSHGFKPVALYADPSMVRSWTGGAGAYKLGTNYGPTIYTSKKAQSIGCQQVLWLFGPDHQITEVGTMNIFVFWVNETGETELVTPPLDSGLILPGITRRCLLELAKEWNQFKVSERSVTMHEIVKALKENRILEIFGSGTACIVCPVDKIVYNNEDRLSEYLIPTMEHQPSLMQKFSDTISGIQYGRIAKPEWIRVVHQ